LSIGAVGQRPEAAFPRRRDGPVTEAERQQILEQTIRRIAEGFHPQMIILFGSYASGKITPDSDIDLLVVMEVEGSRRQMANKIDLALADRMVPMDVIVVTPEQMERQKDVVGTIAYEALRKGRIVYDRAA
jgi:predicted nucleotidyltransferase